MSTKNLSLLAGISLVTVLAGCASTRFDTTSVDQARTALSQAEADPAAVQYAPQELKDARAELNTAEGAAKTRHQVDADHSAYLANRHAQVAMALGRQKTFEAHVAQAGAERQKVLLDARTQEAEAAKAAAQRAQAENERLRNDLAALQASESSRGTVVTLKDVLFATGRAQLQPGAARALDDVARALKDQPDRRVRVEGFTDSTGSDALNDALSQRRADAVRDALSDRGIDPSRIETRGYGKTYPVADNGTAAGRQMNRRVEIIIGKGTGPVAERE